MKICVWKRPVADDPRSKSMLIIDVNFWHVRSIIFILRLLRPVETKWVAFKWDELSDRRFMVEFINISTNMYVVLLLNGQWLSAPHSLHLFIYLYCVPYERFWLRCCHHYINIMMCLNMFTAVFVGHMRNILSMTRRTWKNLIIIWYAWNNFFNYDHRSYWRKSIRIAGNEETWTILCWRLKRLCFTLDSPEPLIIAIRIAFSLSVCDSEYFWKLVEHAQLAWIRFINMHNNNNNIL